MSERHRIWAGCSGCCWNFNQLLLQATKGQQVKVFYTMPEYENWKEEVGSLRGWKIKYYKGLGTSTSKEAKEYFAALDSHRKTFVWTGVARSYCRVQAKGGVLLYLNGRSRTDVSRQNLIS